VPKVDRKTGRPAAGSASPHKPAHEGARQPPADQPLEYLYEPSQLRRYAAQSMESELSQPAPMIGAVVEVYRRIELRRQNRLNRSLVSSETILQVHDGVLALEAVPAGGRRQILDFLMPDDAIPASIAVTFSGFFLRALTNASLDNRPSLASEGTSESPPETSALLCKLRSHLMRRNLHQIMIGQLDSESRVSSFLLMLAMRSGPALRCNRLLPLPMSRDDIADYLAMNPDTLSRIMMRLETLRIIRRLNRHLLNLIDAEKLGLLSPIRALLLTTLGSSGASPPWPSPAISPQVIASVEQIGNHPLGLRRPN
jgi:CRP/FNR family transcriptional regulator, anaerobic regulatory protein